MPIKILFYHQYIALVGHKCPFKGKKKYYLQPWKVSPNAGLTGNTVIFFKKKINREEIGFCKLKKYWFLNHNFQLHCNSHKLCWYCLNKKRINIFIEISFPDGRNLSHALRNNLAKLKKTKHDCDYATCNIFQVLFIFYQIQTFCQQSLEEESVDPGPKWNIEVCKQEVTKALFFLLCGKIFCYILHCKSSKPVCSSLQLHCNSSGQEE